MAETTSDKQTTKEPTGKRNITIGRSPQYSVIYSDAVRMSLSAYDIKLTFSLNETLANNDVLITEELTVVLSPQHAKEFAEKLMANVELYEKDVMPLQVKKEYLEQRKKRLKSIYLGEE